MNLGRRSRVFRRRPSAQRFSDEVVPLDDWGAAFGRRPEWDVWRGDWLMDVDIYVGET